MLDPNAPPCLMLRYSSRVKAASILPDSSHVLGQHRTGSTIRAGIEMVEDIPVI